MLNTKFVTLFVAVLLAVSATAIPCKPCNSGPNPGIGRHQLGLLGTLSVPGLSGGLAKLPDPLPIGGVSENTEGSPNDNDKGPPRVVEGIFGSHLSDLVDVASGKKDPLEVLKDHAQDLGDAVKDAADAAEQALPDAATDMVPEPIADAMHTAEDIISRGGPGPVVGADAELTKGSNATSYFN